MKGSRNSAGQDLLNGRSWRKGPGTAYRSSIHIQASRKSSLEAVLSNPKQCDPYFSALWSLEPFQLTGHEDTHARTQKGQAGTGAVRSLLCTTAAKLGLPLA